MVWNVMFTCDICGKNKGEANHWWMAALGPLDSPSGEEAARFTLMRWSRNKSQDADVYHLCGQGCAMHAMERFMNEGAIDTP